MVFKVGDRVKAKESETDARITSLRKGKIYTVLEIEPNGTPDTLLLTDLNGPWMEFRFELVETPQPKVGDTIRATAKTPVINGTVNYVYNDGSLSIVNNPFIVSSELFDIEILKPKVTLPTKFASLIKLGDVLYARAASEWFTSSGRKYDDAEIQRRADSGAYGKFVVLYEGEDA